MPVTLSDGTTTVDISQSEETKSRIQRLIPHIIPGLYGVQLDNLASGPLQFTFTWMLSDFTVRATIENWQKTNAALTLVDLEYTGGVSVYLASFRLRERPGVPNLVDVELTLIERV